MWELEASDQARTLRIFEHLHRNPEVSWQEYATRDYLLNQLAEAGCTTQTFADNAGIVAQWGPGRPRIALRGDMDALWQEVDGVEKANHSCGHDAHMAIVMGTLYNLKRCKADPTLSVRFVFQPAEEKGLGALKLMEHGAMDGISYFYGVHLRPELELANGLCAPAILHGASAYLTGTINGGDMHAGRPHLGPNAIEVGSALVQAVAGIWLDPMVPYSAKFTRFQAGGASSNIIPGNAVFTIDMRAQTNLQMDRLIAAVQHKIEQVASLTQSEIHFEQTRSSPAAQVDPEAERLLADSIREALGEAALRPAAMTGGADDFHNYTVRKPDLKATMLALGCGLAPGLHHPKMSFDLQAMFRGVQVLTAAVLKTHEQLGQE